MRFRVIVLLAALLSPTHAYADVIDDTFADARAAFQIAAPQLSRTVFGVDVTAYGEALSSAQFTSSHWGQPAELVVTTPDSAGGSCKRFAAYVRIPPENGRVTMVVCPQFRTGGAAELRRLTILHELVHVVAGSDECRAMAFAAQIELLATGTYTPVDRYWSANTCQTSRFSLP